MLCDNGTILLPCIFVRRECALREGLHVRMGRLHGTTHARYQHHCYDDSVLFHQSVVLVGQSYCFGEHSMRSVHVFLECVVLVVFTVLPVSVVMAALAAFVVYIVFI